MFEKYKKYLWWFLPMGVLWVFVGTAALIGYMGSLVLPYFLTGGTAVAIATKIAIDKSGAEL